MTWFRKPGRSTMNLGALTRFALVASLATAARLSAAEDRPVSLPLAGRVDPKAFGIQDDTVTTISAWSFSPAAGTTSMGGGDCPHFSPGPGRYGICTTGDSHYFTTLDLPAGAVIDLVGINTATDSDAIMGLALWQRNRDGSKTMLTGFSLPAHDWATDYAGPLGILIDTHRDREYLLEVERAPTSNYEYFGWVEVWWHRSVSPPPPTPTFGDVPTSDLGYQYVQALVASGVTGGCGGGNFCPDANLTRRQMAIFLAKALGLHWPN